MTPKLTQIERSVLRHIARREPGSVHGLTTRSLERKRLIEHTSLGWRLTLAGHACVDEMEGL